VVPAVSQRACELAHRRLPARVIEPQAEAETSGRPGLRELPLLNEELR
jgi:hypothetical protein